MFGYFREYYNKFFDIYKFINYFLDYIFYYKIMINESYYFKMFNTYWNPPKYIHHAKLCINDNVIDITDQFNKISKNKNKNKISWKDILNFVDHEEHLKKLQESDKFHLDIKYNLEDDHYRIMYHYKDNEFIKFPPYTEEEIKQYKKNSAYKRTILMAELNCDETGNGQDITDIVKEYAGPLNDFYKDKDNVDIHACLIKDDHGKHILLEDSSLLITDSHANDIEFKGKDILHL